MKKRRGDLILIGAILLAAVLLWLGVSLSKSKGAQVLVIADGEEFGRYPLSENAEIKLGEGEHYNLLVIRDGEARVSEASCPDKLCVKIGAISFNGQSIICLPNKTVVEIIGGEDGREDVTAR